MFFGTSTLGDIGVLINQNAIGLLRANTYQAARQLFGPSAKPDILDKAVDAYTKFVVPRTNRALATPEILNDYNFKRIANAAKAGPKSGKDKALDISPGNFGLSDSLLFGLPNWLLYAGAGYAGYKYYKKKRGKGLSSLFGKRKSTRKKSRRTSRRVSFSGVAPVIGGVM